MPQVTDIRDEILSLLAPICAPRAIDVVEVRCATGRGGRVQVFLERAGADPATGSGVTIADCQAVSRALSVELDAREHLFDAPYELEVSSAGIERPLVRLADFARFEGRAAKVETADAVDGRRRFDGKVVGVEASDILIDQDGKTVRIPFGNVKRAHLVHRFER